MKKISSQKKSKSILDQGAAGLGVNLGFVPTGINVYGRDAKFTIATSGVGQCEFFTFAWLTDHTIKITNLLAPVVFECISDTEHSLFSIAKEKKDAHFVSSSTTGTANDVTAGCNMFSAECPNIISWSLGNYAACPSNLHHHLEECDVKVDLAGEITIVSNVQTCTIVLRLVVQNGIDTTERLCVVRFNCPIVPPGPIVVGDTLVPAIPRNFSLVNGADPNADGADDSAEKWRDMRDSQIVGMTVREDAISPGVATAVTALIQLFSFVVYVASAKRDALVLTDESAPALVLPEIVHCSVERQMYDLRTILNLPATAVIRGASIDNVPHFANETTIDGITITAGGTLVCARSNFTPKTYDITLSYVTNDGDVGADDLALPASFSLICRPESNAEYKVRTFAILGRPCFVPFSAIFSGQMGVTFAPALGGAGTFVRNDGFVIGAGSIGGSVSFVALVGGSRVGSVTISTSIFTPAIAASKTECPVSLGTNQIQCAENVGFAWFESDSVQDRMVYAAGSSVTFANVCTFGIGGRTVHLDINPLNASKLPKLRYAVLNRNGSVAAWHAVKFKLTPDAGHDHIVMVAGQCTKLNLQSNDYNPSGVVRTTTFSIDSGKATSTLSFSNDNVKISGDEKGNLTIKPKKVFSGPAFSETIIAKMSLAGASGSGAGSEADDVPITVLSVANVGQPALMKYAVVSTTEVSRGQLWSTPPPTRDSSVDVSESSDETTPAPLGIAPEPKEPVVEESILEDLGADVADVIDEICDGVHFEIVSFVFESRSYAPGSVVYCKAGVLCVYGDGTYAFSPKISTIESESWDTVGDVICYGADGSYAVLSLQRRLVPVGPFTMYIAAGQKTTVALPLPPGATIQNYGFFEEERVVAEKELKNDYGTFKCDSAGIVKVNSKQASGNVSDLVFGSIVVEILLGLVTRTTVINVVPCSPSVLASEHPTHAGKLSVLGTAIPTDSLSSYALNAAPTNIGSDAPEPGKTAVAKTNEVATISKYAHFVSDTNGAYSAWISSAYRGNISVILNAGSSTSSVSGECLVFSDESVAAASANRSFFSRIPKLFRSPSPDRREESVVSAASMPAGTGATGGVAAAMAPSPILAPSGASSSSGSAVLDNSVSRGRSHSENRAGAATVAALQGTIRGSSPSQDATATSFRTGDRSPSPVKGFRSAKRSISSSRTYLMYPEGTVLPQNIVDSVPEEMFESNKSAHRTYFTTKKTFESGGFIFRLVDEEQLHLFLVGDAGTTVQFPAEIPIVAGANVSSDKIVISTVNGQPALKVVKSFAADEIVNVGVFLRNIGDGNEHYSTIQVHVIAGTVLPRTISYNSKFGVSLLAPITKSVKPSGTCSLDLTVKFGQGQSWSGTVNFVDSSSIGSKIKVFPGYDAAGETAPYAAFIGKTAESLRASELAVSRNLESSFFSSVGDLFASFVAGAPVEPVPVSTNNTSLLSLTSAVTDAVVESAVSVVEAVQKVEIAPRAPISSHIGSLGETEAALRAAGDLEGAKKIENERIAAIGKLKRVAPVPIPISAPVGTRTLSPVPATIIGAEVANGARALPKRGKIEPLPPAGQTRSASGKRLVQISTSESSSREASVVDTSPPILIPAVPKSLTGKRAPGPAAETRPLSMREQLDAEEAAREDVVSDKEFLESLTPASAAAPTVAGAPPTVPIRSIVRAARVAPAPQVSELATETRDFDLFTSVVTDAAAFVTNAANAVSDSANVGAAAALAAQKIASDAAAAVAARAAAEARAAQAAALAAAQAAQKIASDAAAAAAEKAIAEMVAAQKIASDAAASAAAKAVAEAAAAQKIASDAAEQAKLATAAAAKARLDKLNALLKAHSQVRTVIPEQVVIRTSATPAPAYVAASEILPAARIAPAAPVPVVAMRGPIVFAPTPKISFVATRVGTGRHARVVPLQARCATTTKITVLTGVPIPALCFKGMEFSAEVGAPVVPVPGGIMFTAPGIVGLRSELTTELNYYEITVIANNQLGSVIPTVKQSTGGRFSVGAATVAAVYSFGGLAPTMCPIFGDTIAVTKTPVLVIFGTSAKNFNAVVLV